MKLIFAFAVFLTSFLDEYSSQFQIPGAKLLCGHCIPLGNLLYSIGLELQHCLFPASATYFRKY